MFALGPFYCWNFQISNLSRYQTYDIINHENLSLIKEQDYPNLLGPLDLSSISHLAVTEEKILFAINAKAQRIDPDSSLYGPRRDNSMVLINTADIRGNSKAILTGESKPSCFFFFFSYTNSRGLLSNFVQRCFELFEANWWCFRTIVSSSGFCIFLYMLILLI